MAQELSEVQNIGLGTAAAFIEAVLLQPTLYWKTARAMKLPFTIDPRIVYRGTAASIFNEMQMMGLQFGLTAFFQKLFVGSSGVEMTDSQQFLSATLGGFVAATTASPVELVMVQQQLNGGTLIGTPSRIIKTYGFGFSGLWRGLQIAMVRDSIYVSGMLGVTPLLQNYLMEKQQWSAASAGLAASMVGGVVAAVPSQPFDVIKTCMQGDMEKKVYKGIQDTCRTVWSEGGFRRIYSGGMWRTLNIVGTVFIANECRIRLPPFLFPSTCSNKQL